MRVSGVQPPSTERDVDENWTPTQQPGFIHAVRAGISEFNWLPLTLPEASSLTTAATFKQELLAKVIKDPALLNSLASAKKASDDAKSE